jgi:type II secretory pathway component PulM
MSRSKQPGVTLSRRDRRLLLGFAVFVEAVLIYMLLVDPAISRLNRARGLEASTRQAHAQLAAAMAPSATAPLPSPTEEHLAPLVPAAHESPTVAIQRLLANQAAMAGARLVEVRVEPQPEDHGALLSHTVDVSLKGAYEAVSAFIADLEASEPVRGVALFEIATAEEAPDQLQASLTLRVYLRKP